MICILWDVRSVRRALVESSVWLVAAIGTSAVYFRGYNFTQNGCLPSSACSPRVALHHPVEALRYFVVLIGNVIPGGGVIIGTPVRNVVRFEIVGVALFAVALFIVVQSWRYRKSRERIPLPLLLIAFALLTDAQITLGRSGLGSTDAISNRYLLVNLILLTGIVIYALANVPPLRTSATNGRRFTWIALAGLAVFLTLQVAVATGFGLTNGRAMSSYVRDDAQLFVNGNRVPERDLACEVYVALLTQPGVSYSFALRLRDAVEDQLGEFRPSSLRYFQALGPPPTFQVCLTPKGQSVTADSYARALIAIIDR